MEMPVLLLAGVAPSLGLLSTLDNIKVCWCAEETNIMHKA